MKIAMIKNNSGLIPVYNKDRENYNKLKEQKPYIFEVKRDRNLRHHRKFWAILTLVVSNSEKWSSPEELLIALKDKLGYRKKVPSFDGTELIYYGSTSFDKMDQDKFDKFYNLSLPLLADEIECSVSDLESNYGEYL